MMIIKIPPHIQIASHTYTLWFDPREDDSDFSGSALYRHHEVLLNPELHHQTLRVTFLHELLHIINLVFDIKAPEETVRGFGEGLANILFNNLDIDFDFSDVPTRKVEGSGNE